MRKPTFRLLKSKDDYTFEHYKTSPMAILTGFVGTAGEAISDYDENITLFVDPRYHIQADIQTEGKNVQIVKMCSQYGFIEYLKNTIPNNSILEVPEKSTSLALYRQLAKHFYIKLYRTDEDTSSINNSHSPIFAVEEAISGLSVQKKIRMVKINNFLITNLEDACYLLNLRSYKTKNSSTFRCKLFIKNNKKVVLFCDYKVPELPDIIEIKPMCEYEDFIKKIKTEIIFDPNSISLYDYSLINKPKPLSDNPIKAMASVKNQCEIKHYEDCFKRLDSALFNFRENLKEGMSEFELNKMFERELKKEGAKTTSFQTILAIGSNSSIIHYTSCSKEKFLTKDDILLLDCGGYYEGGYATDITRVFKLKNANVKDKVKEIYTAVLKAQIAVYDSDSLMTDELHYLAIKMLKKYEKEGFFFPHGLGHGIGIPVHQAPPTLSYKLKTEIAEGNVFTIEPGLYKENEFGIRLENTVYRTGKIKLSLSHFPYEDDLIDHTMLTKREERYLQEWQEFYL